MNQKSPELVKIIEEFREYLSTEKGKYHLKYLKEKEPKETREVLEKLKNLPKDSNEFTEWVLYGLLPNSNSKYAKRVSIAPAFLNIKKFFARFNYTEKDWMELSNLVYQLITGFDENPKNLESLIRDFISHRLSKALQCGSLTPIFFALNSNFPIVNNRERRTYKKISFLLFGQIDELSQRLENYPSNIEKIKRFTKILSEDYGFNEITDMAVLDVFCYWYDEYKIKEKADEPEPPVLEEQEEIPRKPIIDDEAITKFLQVLACSPPQPFLIETLQNLTMKVK